MTAPRLRSYWEQLWSLCPCSLLLWVSPTLSLQHPLNVCWHWRSATLCGSSGRRDLSSVMCVCSWRWDNSWRKGLKLRTGQVGHKRIVWMFIFYAVHPALFQDTFWAHVGDSRQISSIHFKVASLIELAEHDHPLSSLSGSCTGTAFPRRKL